MKAIYMSFMQMIIFMQRDMMLFTACFTPIFAGLFFKFGIPVVVGWTGVEAIVVPYYNLFDLLYSLLAPTMFCYVAAMVILEEHDDHIEQYLVITPLNQKGYLISRLAIPAIIAFITTIVLLPIFKLTLMSTLEIIFLSIMGAGQGVIIALLIVTLSTNKLEGMAITKLSTLTILGALIPYFILSPIQYTLSFLPSFWMGKAMIDSNPFWMIISVLLASVWIILLLKKYLKKIS